MSVLITRHNRAAYYLNAVGVPGDVREGQGVVTVSSIGAKKLGRSTLATGVADLLQIGRGAQSRFGRACGAGVVDEHAPIQGNE